MVPDVEYLQADPATGKVARGWAAAQVATSADFAHGSWFWTHVSGGLNYQVGAPPPPSAAVSCVHQGSRGWKLQGLRGSMADELGALPRQKAGNTCNAVFVTCCCTHRLQNPHLRRQWIVLWFTIYRLAF